MPTDYTPFLNKQYEYRKSDVVLVKATGGWLIEDDGAAAMMVDVGLPACFCSGVVCVRVDCERLFTARFLVSGRENLSVCLCKRKSSSLGSRL